MITWRGLVRYFALFVIDLKTRQVEIAGIVASPDGAWMSQIARNLTDSEDGFLLHCRYLIHDRDPLFTKAFRETLESSGVRPVRLPSRSPNLNAYAERFVRSIKSECLAQVIPIGEGHLRRAVREYVEHYHGERNHQGIGNRLIDSSLDGSRRVGSIECRERLGGLASVLSPSGVELGRVLAHYGEQGRRKPEGPSEALCTIPPDGHWPNGTRADQGVLLRLLLKLPKSPLSIGETTPPVSTRAADRISRHSGRC